ncbi:MAG: hypothetical protein AB7O50_13950 [Pseudolabrys sp.]
MEGDCAAIGVQPANGGWMVEQGTQQAGPYFSNEMALRVAMARIQALVRGGGCARLSVRDARGEPQAQFCRCRQFMHTAAMLRGAAARQVA